MDSSSSSASICEDTGATPIMAKPAITTWTRFYILGKPAQYEIIESTDVTDSESLLFQSDEKGYWLLWCFLEDDWTIDEVWTVYSIEDSSDIASINVRYRSFPELEGFVVTDDAVKTEFMSIMGQCDILSLHTWMLNNNFSSQDTDTKTILFVDINTVKGNTLTLTLHPYANCLGQKNECFFQLPDGGGEQLFHLLTGMSSVEFKESIGIFE